MKVVTASEMREIDRISIEETGIPGELLMNNAGIKVSGFVEKNFPGKSVTVFCGPGNNGGDGFTAAYYLSNSGIEVTVYLSCIKSKVSATSSLFLKLCENTGIEIIEYTEEKEDPIAVSPDSVILDAVLGTGFSGATRGIPGYFIRSINSSGAITISIDIPSGLASDGQPPEGDCVSADYTITIGLPKVSLVTYPSKKFCGVVTVADIGFPSHLTASDLISVNLTDRSLTGEITSLTGDSDTHKGERGHTLFIGGFSGMEGAALLSSSALFRTGCGLLTIATVTESRNVIAGKIPEAMTIAIPDDPDTPFIKDFIDSKKVRAVIIGPGMGRSLYAEKIFFNFIKILDVTTVKTVIIDGDALYHLVPFLKRNRLPAEINFIITPHFMEASRILDLPVETIRNDRLNCCRDLAMKTGSITVLKGPSSIISDGKISYINTTGNNGLATAGSGDTLCGIIASFASTGAPALKSVAAAVYIHGLTAEIYAKSFNSRTMSATDIIDNIKNALTFAIKSE